MYKFKVKFQLSNEFISSESEEIQKTMQLSEPLIQIITPTNNYHINDVIPITITITITNRKGQPIPNLGFTLTINGTSYSCTTNSEGIYTFDYTILTDDDLEVTITTNITSVYDTVTVEETIAIDSREYTNLSIVSSASSTIFLNGFTLTATLKDANGNLINGAVKFYEGSTLLGTVNTTNGVAQYTVSNASITSHTYHAVFEQTTDYHEATSSNVTVNVTKDTPKLSKLTGDLYSGWVTACQLTNSKGTALSSKTVSIKISTNNSTWSTYNKTTNSSGKASQTITGGAQKIYVQYVFAGDSQYNVQLHLQEPSTYSVLKALKRRQALSYQILLAIVDHIGNGMIPILMVMTILYVQVTPVTLQLLQVKMEPTIGLLMLLRQVGDSTFQPVQQ